MKGKSGLVCAIFCVVFGYVVLVIFGCALEVSAFPNAGTPDAWRGARIFDDYRFYNTSSGTGTLSSASRCRGCHGWQGETPVGDENEPLYQRIAQMSQTEVAQAIRDGRTGTAMPAFSGIFQSAYNPDQQYVDLAAFLKTLLRQYSLPPTDGTAADGQTVYTASCQSCHGADGRSIDFHQGTSEPPEYLGAAREEAAEFAHRIIFGHARPDTQQTAIWSLAMPVWGRTWNYETDPTTVTGRVADLIALLQTAAFPAE